MLKEILIKLEELQPFLPSEEQLCSVAPEFYSQLIQVEMQRKEKLKLSIQISKMAAEMNFLYCLPQEWNQMNLLHQQLTHDWRIFKKAKLSDLLIEFNQLYTSLKAPEHERIQFLEFIQDKDFEEAYDCIQLHMDELKEWYQDALPIHKLWKSRKDLVNFSLILRCCCFNFRYT